MNSLSSHMNNLSSHMNNLSSHMNKLQIYLLVLLIILQCTTGINAANVTDPTAMNYVTASCKTTRYPSLCVRCLSTYARSIQGNDQLLAKAAISVTLNNAKSAAAYVTKLSHAKGLKPQEFQAVKDCVNGMNSCVPSLNQSVQELTKMARLTGQNFEWHMSNVETWVSSALTNQNTCARGFSDGSMKGPVKDAVIRRMSYVAQLTSNALALVNRFALRHKATHRP